MLRLIYYDISDTKARTKVSKYLEAQGFDRLQYSVFVGKIESNRWEKVRSQLAFLFEKHCKSDDKIFSHVVERDHFKNMSIFGRGPDKAWILHEIEVLFI